MWKKLIQKMRNSNLAYKLIVSIVVIVAIPIMLLGFFNYKNMYDQIKLHSIQEAQSDMSIRKSQITEKIKAIENFATNLGYSLYLGNFLAADYSVDNHDEYMELRSYLLSMLGSNSKYISNISIYYSNNTLPEHWPIFFHISRLEDEYRAKYDMESEVPKWFANENIELKDIEHSKYYFFKDDEIIFISPMISNVSDKFLGFIKIGVKKDVLFSSIKSNADDNVAYMVWSNDQILYNPQGNDVSMEYATFDDVHWTHDENLIIKENVLEIDADLISVTKGKVILDGARKASINVILSVISCVILASAAIWLIVTVLFKKMNDVIRTMHEASKGDLKSRVSVETNDEIGVLAKSFNHMLDSIEALQSTVVQRERTLKVAEINALQAQINPHFIYNTLAIFQSKLEAIEQKALSRSIHGLGQMLRYSTNWSKETDLSQELMHARHYCDLQYKDINLFVNCEARLKKHRVPKMIIQPIVENSIIHGMADKKAMSININVYSADSTLIIEVFDDGVGIPMETVEMMNRALAKEDDHIVFPVPKHRGIGLNNINDRIQLAFGMDSLLIIESEEGLYTKVTIQLPLTEKEPACTP